MKAEKLQKRARFFIYAPPIKGVRKSKRKEPVVFDRSAPRWTWSVYYYWWEYLRRHEGYRATCEHGGTGEYARLYDDFGDVHQSDFWTWWVKHEHLFCEPPPRLVERVAGKEDTPNDMILLAIPAENKLSLTIKQVRKLLDGQVSIPKKKPVSQARFPVAAKPVLSSLHQHLVVFDAKRDNPQLSDAQIADLVKLPINNWVDGETLTTLKARLLPTVQVERVLRRRKQIAVQRHVRIAKQYIDNVGEGKFPVRTSR